MSTDAAPPPPASFAELGVKPWLQAALAGVGISAPTPVQAASIPAILKGRDCVASAPTGSGKTAAFALPILQTLSEDPYGVYALVLTPTRELAHQITEQFAVFGKTIGLRCETVVGGVDMLYQTKAIAQRPHVIVATPGRLADVLRSAPDAFGPTGLRKVRYLVLDEVDALLAPDGPGSLNGGFTGSDTATIIGALGPRVNALGQARRQTLLFSATMTGAAIEAVLSAASDTAEAGSRMSDLAQSMIKAFGGPLVADPFLHQSTIEHIVPPGLDQRYVFIPSTVKDAYLYHIVACVLKGKSVLIFVGRRRTAEKLRLMLGQLFAEPPAHLVPSSARLKGPAAAASRKRNLREATSKGALKKSASLNYAVGDEDADTQATGSDDFTESPPACLHSAMSQRERLVALNRFRSKQARVLICTDVASRGLDIPHVHAVINYDVPAAPTDYIHRIGRAGRAGRAGRSVTLITETDIELVHAIEARVGQKMDELEVSEPEVLRGLNTIMAAQKQAVSTMMSGQFDELETKRKAKRPGVAAAAAADAARPPAQKKSRK
ncbi:hypothetical protein H696_02045 [Fonticula alba]|uniref:ATP-dependent RNA helicase DBP8 n=1 Tax=Fonticula alba TaxID=691883 RepID=A0A058ZAZ9_FONAL|nr:hypothetical protein H696_02045 [Fonticula alba]KCV71098.1 hypothetical protein H696_02045 [Fonticula alba]|eukprot:XP_009494221.1 hypothetical protein H696_02045 [Fonticula alba]